MDPRLALSPRSRIAPGSLNVIFTAKDTSWSLAQMLWDTKPALGIRWNGDLDDHSDKGNPRSHANGTWFILPEALATPIIALTKLFGSGYTFDRPPASVPEDHL